MLSLHRWEDWMKRPDQLMSTRAVRIGAAGAVTAGFSRLRADEIVEAALETVRGENRVRAAI